MKFVSSLILTFAFLNSATASYRDKMVGSSRQEREIRWVWKYLGEFVESCVQSKAQCQSSEYLPLLKDLKSYLQEAEPKKWNELLEFVSEKERPDLFRSDRNETHRIAVTGFSHFSKVYVNTERMNLNLKTWVGILIHEALHHLNTQDDNLRMPDRVGAEVALHFEKKVMLSSLEQFNQPGVRALSFNSSAANRASLGFISWDELQTSDLDWGPSQLQPVCQATEVLQQQFVSGPIWRVNRIRPEQGVVTVLGGGYVKTVCQDSRTGRTRETSLPLLANLNLQYKAPFNFSNWREETPSIIIDQSEFSPSANPGHHVFGLAQTFIVTSLKFERSVLSAGETLKTQITVKSTDEFRPQKCELYLAGTQYAYMTYDRLPGVNFFRTCRLAALANGDWLLEGEIDFPPNTRPDSYFIPMIVLNDPTQGDRTAIPTKPQFVEVKNPNSAIPPKITSMKILGLPEATKLGSLDLTSSFRATDFQEFTIELKVEGEPTVSSIWMDVNFWYPGKKEFMIANGTGSSASMRFMLLNEEFIRTSANSTTVILKFRMPNQIQGIPIASIQFRRIYMRSSDFSWVEIERSGQHDTHVINSRFGR